jgi:molybdopterin-guanine dinucleotide biosynthesis protein
MKVFLSYALSPFEGALASRLRAVALAYNVELLLPNADNRNLLPLGNKRKIKQSDAVIVLVTNNAQQIDSVNLEIAEASREKKPLIALVEGFHLIKGMPPAQIIVFNRHHPTQHENQLFEALKQIKAQKNVSEAVTVLGAIGLVALGFLALDTFAKDGK